MTSGNDCGRFCVSTLQLHSFLPEMALEPKAGGVLTGRHNDDKDENNDTGDKAHAHLHVL